MMERRPHWDIDLVEGVGRRIIPRYRSIGYCTDAERHRIYTLIEFVEDWMDANDNPLPHVINECLQWLDAERAAIARVRALLDRADSNGEWSGMLIRVEAVRHALEGDSDD